MDNKKRIMLWAILIAAVVIGGWYNVYRNNLEIEESKLASETDQTDPRNLTYIVDGRSVVLVDGVSSSTEGDLDIETVLYDKHSLNVDLNGDDIKDKIVLLVDRTGGTGVFYYVSAVLSKDGKAITTPAQFIGDRIYVEGISSATKAGTINVSILDRAVGKSFADEPTVKRKFVYKIVNNNLVGVK